MKGFTLFGLRIHSDLPMPGLPTSYGEPDVVVRYGTLKGSIVSADTPLIRADQDEALFYWDAIGHVLVREGKEIILDPLPEAGEAVVRHIAQGVAMGVLLHQRGLFTLHASAVAVDGGVAAFIGWKGWGKSTTAAALHACGHAVVTDDILALDLRERVEGVEVVPGVPHFKLWPDAVMASLNEDPEALPRIFGPSIKRVRPTLDGAQQTPLPLACIYVLDYDAEQTSVALIEPISPRDACIELIRHSYALRFLPDQIASPVHLQQCVYLLQRVPVRRLKRRPGLEKLPGLIQAIENDLNAGAGRKNGASNLTWAGLPNQD